MGGDIIADVADSLWIRMNGRRVTAARALHLTRSIVVSLARHNGEKRGWFACPQQFRTNVVRPSSLDLTIWSRSWMESGRRRILGFTSATVAGGLHTNDWDDTSSVTDLPNQSSSLVWLAIILRIAASVRFSITLLDHPAARPL